MRSSWWIYAARQGLRPWPLAARFFNHYLHGQGRSVSVKTSELMADDEGVRSYVLNHIDHSLSEGERSGTILLQQPVFTNTQWRLALGSIQLHWEKINQSVILHFEKNYHWTPATKRISRHIHRAADYAKRNGAAEFSMIGKPAKFSLQDLRLDGVAPKAPLLGNLYL